MKNLSSFKIGVAIFLGGLWSASALAASAPVFVNLDQQDFEGIVNDFSGALAYTSVSPASSLGKLFGFEVGLVAGAADTPRINTLVQEAAPGETVSMVPDATLLGVVSLPFGLTGEVEVLPKESALQNQITDTSVAVAFKWTFSQLLDMPVDTAIKVYSKSAEVTYSGTVSGQPVDFDFKDTITGVEFQLSKSFIVFEPYLTLGYLRGKGAMTVTGTGAGNVFSAGYTVSQSASEVMTSPDYALGLNVNLVILKLGAEVGEAFHNTKFAGKVSFYF